MEIPTFTCLKLCIGKAILAFAGGSANQSLLSRRLNVLVAQVCFLPFPWEGSPSCRCISQTLGEWSYRAGFGWWELLGMIGGRKKGETRLGSLVTVLPQAVSLQLLFLQASAPAIRYLLFQLLSFPPLSSGSAFCLQLSNRRESLWLLLVSGLSQCFLFFCHMCNQFPTPISLCFRALKRWSVPCLDPNVNGSNGQ